MDNSLIEFIIVGVLIVASWIDGYEKGYRTRDDVANKEKAELRNRYLEIKERYR